MLALPTRRRYGLWRTSGRYCFVFPGRMPDVGDAGGEVGKGSRVALGASVGVAQFVLPQAPKTLIVNSLAASALWVSSGVSTSVEMLYTPCSRKFTVTVRVVVLPFGEFMDWPREPDMCATISAQCSLKLGALR